MLSNAPYGRGRGGRAPSTRQPAGNQQATKPQGVPVVFSSQKPEKDAFRSKLRELAEVYKPLCNVEPTGAQRFRVRGEILPHGEDYFTIEFGCKVDQIIDLPWGEYPSMELQIRYGSAIELTKLVQIAVRRSDRIGRESLSVAEALRLKRSDPHLWGRLMMSAKDFKNLPRVERDAGAVAVPAAAPGRTFYQDQANVAMQQMQTSARNSQRQESRVRDSISLEPVPRDPSRRWSDDIEDEEESSSSPPKLTKAPFTEQRAGSSLGKSGKGSLSESRPMDEGGRNRPPVPTTSSSTPGRRVVPPSTTNG